MNALTPLETLFDVVGGTALPLPPDLTQLYGRLAFPLHPPGRGDDPERSRLPELEAVTVPVLIVQGESDAFGMPPEGRRRRQPSPDELALTYPPGYKGEPEDEHRRRPGSDK